MSRFDFLTVAAKFQNFFDFYRHSLLKLWQSFLTGFNGRSFFLEDFWDSSDKLELFTDAAGSLGFGAVFGGKWCYGKWPDNWLHQNIAMLEFYPIVLSLYLWGHHMQNRCILFLTDNEALVYVINKQSCKDIACVTKISTGLFTKQHSF